MRLAIVQGEQVKGTTYPNPPVGAVILDRAGDVAGVGGHAAAGWPACRGDRVARERGAGQGWCRSRHPGTLQPPRSHPAMRGCPCGGRCFVGRATRSPIPTRWPRRGGAAGRIRCRRRRRGAGPTSSRTAHCASGCTSSAPDCPWSPGNSRPASMAAAPPPTDTSQWITSEAARADVHLRRAAADAIIVGTGTVFVDDPTLTARLPDGSARRAPAAARRGRHAGDHRRMQMSSTMIRAPW